jgi:hypothetical protein
MHKVIVLIIAMLAVTCLAQEQAVPTCRVLPEDIEPDSVGRLQSGTHLFAVRFTYTESSAKKMLAFWREHAGHAVLTQVGNFECLTTIAPLETRPSGWTEEGWLKRRTDKICVNNEDDVKKIMEGLRKR